MGIAGLEQVSNRAVAWAREGQVPYLPASTSHSAAPPRMDCTPVSPGTQVRSVRAGSPLSPLLPPQHPVTWQVCLGRLWHFSPLPAPPGSPPLLSFSPCGLSSGLCLASQLSSLLQVSRSLYTVHVVSPVPVLLLSFNKPVTPLPTGAIQTHPRPARPAMTWPPPSLPPPAPGSTPLRLL